MCVGERGGGGGVLSIGSLIGIKKVKVLVAQLCLTLCNPTDYSLPGSSVHGIIQARILSGLPSLSPEDFPDPGIKPTSPTLAGGFFTTVPPGKPLCLGLSSCKPTYSRRDTIKPPHALTTIITFIGRSVRILWPCFKTITESNLPNTIIRM